MAGKKIRKCIFFSSFLVWLKNSVGVFSDKENYFHLPSYKNKLSFKQLHVMKSVFFFNVSYSRRQKISAFLTHHTTNTQPQQHNTSENHQSKTFFERCWNAKRSSTFQRRFSRDDLVCLAEHTTYNTLIHNMYTPTHLHTYTGPQKQQHCRNHRSRTFFERCWNAKRSSTFQRRFHCDDFVGEYCLWQK